MRLSATSLQMLFRCGVQYAFRYIKGIVKPPGWALIVGKSVDEAVTRNLAEKIAKGTLLPKDAVLDIARDAVDHNWTDDVRLEPDQEAAWSKLQAKAEAIDTSVMLAGLHHEKAAPRIEPTHVQRKWELDVEGADLTLSGVIDIQEGARAIRDTKTSKKSPQPTDAHTSVQLSMYAMAVWKEDGELPKEVALDYLVHTKEPKLVQIVSSRSPQDFDHLVQRIAAASEAIRRGVFVPAPLDSWWCSERWCGYWSECPYARRPVSIQSTSTGGSNE